MERDQGNDNRGEVAEGVVDIQVSTVDGSAPYLPSEYERVEGEEAGLKEPVMQEVLPGPSTGRNKENNASKEADSSAIAKAQVTERIWRCIMCPETFGEKTIMKFHCKSHDGHRKYMCPRCPKQFKNAEACNIHYNAHYVTKHYSCGKCDKEFAKKTNLVKHQEMHAQVANRSKKPGRWACLHCTKSFSKKSDWIHHRAGLPCLERKRVTDRLRESCRRLTELVNALDSSTTTISSSSSVISSSSFSSSSTDSEMYTLADISIPDTTMSPISPPREAASDDSDGSIEDNNNSGSDSEDSEYQITSTTKD